MANYTKAERETSISFNDEEQTARIYTCQTPMQRKLERLAAEYPDEISIRKRYSDSDGMIVDIPKTWIKIRTPMKMTAEQRQHKADAMRARMSKT